MSVLSKIKRNLLWQVLSFLPKEKNKVVCQSSYGRGFSDSPAPIARELLSRGWKVYWTVKGEDEARTLPEGITPLKIDSAKAIYHLCTASVWVDNARKWAYTQKRGKTYYVQTWHGFPLKRIEKDAEDALPADYIAAAKKDSEMADLFISDSAFLTDIYRKSFWYDGDILECGFPRNDILTRENPDIAEKVRKELKLPENKKLLLYAPTFRKDMTLSSYDVDYKRCTEALSRRFGGEWIVLLKLHPNISEKARELPLDPDVAVNASDYADIQELYIASSALLTDYSSVMFDYLCTGKPCFLYVNDIENYRGDRNFYFDISKLPFPLAETNGGLEEVILGYDEATEQRREEFRKEFGMAENGSAAKQTVDYIEKKMKGWYR